MNDTVPTEGSRTVLIVDDEEDVANSYAGMLSPTYNVKTANGGEEALEMVNAEVDVVLLDRRMPDRHGDEVLAEIRSRDIDCRIIMVTAVKPDLDVITLDFDEYLVKPVSAATIQDAVERMLARINLDRRLRAAFSLASKMATLEAKMDIDELENSEEYAELESRLAEYRGLFAEADPSDDLYANLSTTKMESLFADR